MSTDWRKRWTGKWALITGASAGIGWALSELLASAGVNLVLTARRADRLEALSRDLAAKWPIRAETVVVDLEDAAGVDKICVAVAQREIEVELLVNNAGFGAFGYTQDIAPEKLAGMIQVNCTAVTLLTHAFLPGMIGRRQGDIMIVASVAGFQPVPFNSVYAATKAFDLLFAEGLAQEVKEFGVRVSALCPGSTETEFQQVAGQPKRALRVAETAEQVARAGLDGLARGKTTVISGWRNKLMIEAERLAPRAFIANQAAKMMSPKHLK